MPATPPPRLTRRTALGVVGLAGVGLTALTGCDSPGSSATGSPTAQATEITPDVRLAIGLLPGLRLAEATTVAAIAQFPQLRKPFASLLATQKAHLKVLTEAVPAHARQSSLSTTVLLDDHQKSASQQVLRRAHASHDALNAAALKAQSGEFARLLASMGAGLSQRLAVIEGTA